MFAAGSAGRAQRPYRELPDECSIFGRWSACSADSRPPQPRRHSHPSSSAALVLEQFVAWQVLAPPNDARNPSIVEIDRVPLAALTVELEAQARPTNRYVPIP
jgi:hypothetical protein